MENTNKFFKIYMGFVIGFIILIIAGLSVFYSFLKTYESAQPKSIAQKICDNYISTGDFWSLKENYSINISDYETKENVNGILGKYIGKDVELNYSSRVPNGSDICFVLKSNNDNLMSIALKKADKTSGFGITGYKVTEITILKDIFKSATISFPSDAKITVNSKALEELYIKKQPLPEINGVEVDDNSVFFCLATVDNLINNDIDVKTESADSEIVKDGNIYTVNQKFSDDFRQEIETFAINGAQTYAAHMQDEIGLNALNKYFDTTSDFYKNVKNTVVNFALDHDSYEFENVQCTELWKHSDKIYSCRIKFTHALKKGSRMYRDAFDKKVYILIDEDGKKIIDMQSVE